MTSPEYHETDPVKLPLPVTIATLQETFAAAVETGVPADAGVLLSIYDPTPGDDDTPPELHVWFGWTEEASE